MAYSEALATRIRAMLAGEPGIVEKKMFGGAGFLVFGNMVCGVLGDQLVARMGRDRYEEILAMPGVRKFDLTGREMRGWVFVEPDAIRSDEDLGWFVSECLAFARSLPPK